MLIVRLSFTSHDTHDQYIGEKGYLELSDKIEWFAEGANKRFESSLMTKYEHCDSILYIEAIDAAYRFEIISGTFEHESIILADPKIIEKIRKREEAKTNSFHCIASPITSDARRKSVVSFTQRMNLAEARKHIHNNMVFSKSGDVVLEILTPILSQKGKAK